MYHDVPYLHEAVTNIIPPEHHSIIEVKDKGAWEKPLSPPKLKITNPVLHIKGDENVKPFHNPDFRLQNHCASTTRWQ